MRLATSLLLLEPLVTVTPALLERAPYTAEQLPSSDALASAGCRHGKTIAFTSDATGSPEL